MPLFIAMACASGLKGNKHRSIESYKEDTVMIDALGTKGVIALLFIHDVYTS
jgi:hypothetical protein